MRRAVLTTAALVVVAAGAWLARPRGDARPPAADPSQGAGAIDATRVDAPHDLSPAPEGVREPMARGRCSIVGTVRGEKGPVAASIEITFVTATQSHPDGPAATSRWMRALRLPSSVRARATRTMAGPDGRYSVDDLGPAAYRVTATTDAGARGAAVATLLAEGARAQADVGVASAGETLKGRVVETDGRPFTGVVFVGRAASWTDVLAVDPGTRVPLDASGRFVAAGLPRGEVMVTALEDGVRLAKSEPVALPQAGEFVLTVASGAVVRDGRVVAADDGRPIAGATLLAAATSAEKRIDGISGSTDANGGFRLAIPVGRGGIRAWAEGFAPIRTPLDELPAAPEPIVIRLARGASLTGRAATTDGRPVAGVSVRVLLGSQDDSYFPRAPATTDADGHYRVSDLPAGAHVVIAQGGGFVDRSLAAHGAFGLRPPAATLVAGATQTLDFEMVQAVSVTGVVLDPSGAPIRGALVRAHGRESPTSYSSSGAIENSDPDPVASTADGTFVVDGLVGSAMYVFSATTPDGTEGRSGFVTASESKPAHVEIRLVPGRTLVVTVVDATTGAPIEGATVGTSVVESTFLEGESATSATDADGRVKLSVPGAKALRLEVRADGYRERWGDAARVGATDSAVQVKLERGFLVSGQALLADGSAAANVEIYAVSDEGRPGDPGLFSSYTDADGRFRMTFDTPGERVIRAKFLRSGTHLVAAVTATAGGEPVVLRLAPAGQAAPLPGALVVRVVGPDGSIVPRASVEIAAARTSQQELEGGRLDVRISDRDGAWIAVSRAAARDGSPLPFGPARVGPISATTTEVEVRLPRERTVEGVVLGPDGKGVAGATVTAHWKWSDERQFEGSSDAITGADGSFRIGRLPEGPVTLRADVPPIFPVPAEFVTQTGAAGVEIRLTQGISVTITVLDDEGKPVAGASVSAVVVGRMSLDRTGRTDPKGVARIGGLEASTKHLLQVQPNRAESLRDRMLYDWTPADTTVRLARAFRVAGHVRDPAGRPVARAEVWASNDVDIWSTSTGEDGSFAFDELEGGEVVVHASIEGALGECDGSIGAKHDGTRVAPGSTDVVLTLDPGRDVILRVADWVDGEPDARAVMFEPGTRPPAGSSGSITSDGVARVRGLKPDRAYTLWIAPTKDGRSLLRPDVRIGDATDPIAVTLASGMTIRGHITVPKGATVHRVLASRDGLMIVGGRSMPDGTYAIAGLPEGVWRVWAAASRGDERFQAEIGARAGDEVDLVLK